MDGEFDVHFFPQDESAEKVASPSQTSLNSSAAARLRFGLVTN